MSKARNNYHHLVCPKCGQRSMLVYVRITGGCQGHLYPDDNCYCDLPDVNIELNCVNHEVNCGFGTEVSEASDRYSLGYFLEAHAADALYAIAERALLRKKGK